MAELLILGSGTGVPNAKRSAPGYLLNSDGKNVLIDSGSGTLHKLICYSVTYQDIDYIFYSHLHPDHTLDFVSMLFAARNPKSPRKNDLTVIGPKGLEDFYGKLLSLYGKSITPESYRIIFKEMEDSELDLGNFKINTRKMAHTERSIGCRIEFKSGGSLVYSGDTGYCDAIVELARDVEVLLLECSAPDEFETGGHLTPSLAGKIASRARCEKLVLTHFYPICDRYPILNQARKTYRGKIILAKDSMRIGV